MIAKEFTIPKFVKFGDGSNDRYAKITVEPFERGYGTTVGNSLRRVLLASLEGSAVTAIRIEGINHEFSAIPGVQEDVTDVILNLKKCEIRLNREEPLIFEFKHKGAGPITVGSLFKDQGQIDVFNPDFVLFNATSKTAEIKMEVKVDRGRGFVTAELLEESKFLGTQAPLGTIYLDANFSPVTKVNFQVEDARVGQATDFDRLILDIWTNGAITPELALEEASRLLIDHLRIFVKQDQEIDEDGGMNPADDPELMKVFAKPVEELELSVRSANCLRQANIRTIGELVARQEAEMMGFHNFGKKSLDEIKEHLVRLGLNFGMKVPIAVAPLPSLTPAMGLIEDDEEPIEEEE